MSYTTLGKLVKQKYPQYNDLSDEELGQKVSVKYPQYQDIVNQPDEQTTTTVSPVKETKESFFEKIAPAGGSILGGYAGPVGTGLGYSIADSLREIVKQYRQGGQDVLANLYGKTTGLKLTPRGKQEAEKLGYAQGVSVKPKLLEEMKQQGKKLSTTPEFSYQKAATENLKNPENRKEALDFVKKNVTGAVVSGVSDAAFRKATDLFLNKLLPKVSAKFKASGVTPSKIASSADKAAQEAWGPIQQGLEKSRKAGELIEVTDEVNKLDDMINGIKSKFGNNLPSSAQDEITGIQGVIDDLRSASQVQKTGPAIDLSAVAPKTGGRPVHQELLEEAMNSKDFKKIGVVLDSMPDTDPYKSAMESFFRQYVPDRYFINPEGAQKLKSYFTQGTFNPISKLGKVSSNIETSAALNAQKIVSPSLRNKIIGLLEKNGIKNAKDLYSQYGVLSNLADAMKRNPFKGIQNAYLSSFLTGMGTTLVGAPPAVGAAVGLGTFVGGTPIGQQVAREAVKLPFKVAPTVARPTVSTLMQEFLKGNK